ncbi:hypothetical protein OJ996_25580 [Luteolibacter sp. GHJ8]|uniref:Uncharacterized protein n=1 Tax=Luteolibacter rhizosphaerae TaxID=2989719 RepID=A0ABT3GAW2_9BACT|nr:hypothetical protein [Luteolibacter rhizosphaerae]MCW1916986.1 hypothetical protein [Luteolibacter rhizosphaerae]
MKLFKTVSITAILALLVIYGIGLAPSALKGEEIYKRRMVAHANAAKDVELQWTYEGAALKSEPMGLVSFQEWLARLPVKTGRMKAPMDKCHIPHHRILLKTGTGVRKIDICLGCDSIRMEGEGVASLPKEWRAPIIELFGSVDIPSERPGKEVVMANLGKLRPDLQIDLFASGARQRLNELLEANGYLGGVQAMSLRLEENYRKILGEAMRSRTPEALHALLKGNADAKSLVGNAGQTHGHALLWLMQSWGDDSFSAALREEPREVQKRTVEIIEQAWAEPRWELYPETGKLR